MQKLQEQIEKVLGSEDVKNLIKEEVEKLSNEKCDEKLGEYIDALDAETEKYIDEKLEKIARKCGEILEDVVESFVSENAGTFKNYQSTLKTDAILEALTTVCKIAGVNAETIMNEANESDLRNSNKNEKLLQQRITCLQKQIYEAEEQLNDKEKELEEKQEEIEKLESKISDKEKEKENITEEKNKIAKLGLIAELGSGLGLTESEEFKKKAEDIPFTMNESYIKRLKTLRESIVEKHQERLEEVIQQKREKEEQQSTWLDRFV